MNMKILVGSHNYMSFFAILFQSLLLPSQQLFTKIVFVVFLNKNIFVIYRGPNVCISCPIVLKVEWFKVEICQKCMYSFTAFIFLYLMMNFLFIVDKTFGFLIHGFSISTKLLNYFLAFVIRYTLGVFLSYKPCVITTRIRQRL